MSFDSDSLLDLLPAIYRLRDEEAAARLEGLLTPAEAAEQATLAALFRARSSMDRRVERSAPARRSAPRAWA